MAFASIMREKVGALKLPASSTKPSKWVPTLNNKDSEVEHILVGTSYYIDKSLASDFVKYSIDTKVNERKIRDAFGKKGKKLLVMNQN